MQEPHRKSPRIIRREVAYTEAGEATLTRQNILRISAEWDRLLDSQIQVLRDARELEASGAWPRFHLKNLHRYRDSVRPQGEPPGAI